MKQIFTLVLLMTTLLTYAQSSGDGEMDATFGTGGLVYANPVDFSESVNFIDEQKLSVISAGKIIQVFSINTGGPNDIGVIRYNSDGSIDNSFGINGADTVDFGGGDDIATSLALQSDGKIIVGGYSYQGGINQFVLARFNSDGTLDNTFNGTGRIISSFASDVNLNALIVQPDNKIVVAGSIYNPGSYDFLVARYNSDGTIDNSFGTGGNTKTAINLVAGGTDQAFALTLQTDGKIILGGSAQNSTVSAFALARYLPNGTLDNTFNSTGIVTTTINSNDVARSVVVQQDGKILAGGYTSNGSDLDFALTRYLPNGQLDATFNSTGKVVTNISTEDRIYSILLQSDSKILVGGSSNKDFAVARYMATGQLDPSFNSNGPMPGINTIDFGYDDYGLAMAFQNSDIIVGGISGTSLALTRLSNSAPVVTLPVTIVSFTAARQNYTVQLNWQTNEVNTVYYDIQRSSDGTHFTSIGNIRAKGSKATMNNYSFTDTRPYRKGNYYRLRVVDNDKKETLSPILYVAFDNEQFSVQAYPNPARDHIRIQIANSSGICRIMLLDVMGRIIQKADITSNSTLTSADLDLSKLQRGVYFIKVNDQTLRVVKE